MITESRAERGPYTLVTATGPTKEIGKWFLTMSSEAKGWIGAQFDRGTDGVSIATITFLKELVNEERNSERHSAAEEASQDCKVPDPK